MSPNIQIIGVGSPLVDMLVHVTDDFLCQVPGSKGGMELVEHTLIDDILERHERELFQVSGGSAANTIVGLANLGMSCTFLGKLGNDSLGRFYTDTFTRAGVCTRRFKYCGISPTGRCLSMITPDSERTCRTFLGAAMNLNPEEVSVDDFLECRHAHVEGYKLFNRDLAIAILECAKEAGCSVSLDLASFEVVRDNRDILDGILEKCVDIVFANEDEAAAFCGSDDPLTGLEALGNLCDIAVVKVGADGAWLKQDDAVVKVDTERVDAVDTTGAGDLWAAGFLYGYFNGLSLATCGRIGSMLGSRIVRHVGASLPDEHWPEILRHILAVADQSMMTRNDGDIVA